VPPSTHQCPERKRANKIVRARTISCAIRRGLDTHGICNVYRNEPFPHIANAMCTFQRWYDTCPGTCADRLGAMTQVNRARAHDYWTTSPNKIDQSARTFQSICTSTGQYHHFHSHPARASAQTSATMAPKTKKQTVNKKDGK